MTAPADQLMQQSPQDRAPGRRRDRGRTEPSSTLIVNFPWLQLPCSGPTDDILGTHGMSIRHPQLARIPHFTVAQSADASGDVSAGALVARSAEDVGGRTHLDQLADTVLAQEEHGGVA